DIGRKTVWQTDAHSGPLGIGFNVQNDPGGFDVALHDVATESIGRRHCGFDIDGIAGGFSSQRGQVECLDHDVSGECLVGVVGDSQTYAVDGDGIAATDVGQHAGNFNSQCKCVI